MSIDWEPHVAGVLAFERTGQALPVELIDSIRRNKVALKGPVTTPIGAGVHQRQRRAAQGARPVRQPAAGVEPAGRSPSRFQGVDLVIVRENTEDLYAGLEHEVVPGVVESLKIITEKASTRIAQFAFEHARTHGRRKVTAIHKANIMKLSDGLFLDSVRRVARDYIDIAYDERIVDAACMQLVMNPEQFDVLVLPNLYGDIVSDLCAGLVGGLGVVGAANLGTDIGGVRGGARQRAGHRGQEPREPDGAAAVGGADAAAHRRGRRRPIASWRRSARCSRRARCARAIWAARRRRSEFADAVLPSAHRTRLTVRRLQRAESTDYRLI